MYTCSEHGWQSFYYPCPGCVVTTSGVTTSGTQPLKEPVEEKNFGTWLQKNYFPKEEPVESQEDLWEQVEQAFMDYMPNELKEYLMKNFFITRKPN